MCMYFKILANGSYTFSMFEIVLARICYFTESVLKTGPTILGLHWNFIQVYSKRGFGGILEIQNYFPMAKLRAKGRTKGLVI